DCGLCLSCRAAGHPPAGTATGTGPTEPGARSTGLRCLPRNASRSPDPRRAATAPPRNAHSMNPFPFSLFTPLLSLTSALPCAAIAAVDCRASAADCESRSSGSLALIDRSAPVAVLTGEDDFAAVHHAADALRGDLAAVAGDMAAQSARSDDTAII